MKTSKKNLLLLLLVVVFVCSFYILWSRSPVAEEYRWQTYPETEIDLASNFAYALSINQPVVYEWIDPSLKPRLDEWMNTHQSKKCTREFDVFLVGPDVNGDYDVRFSCFGVNRPIRMEIDNIVIEDMKVIDWGEVREGD